MESLVAMAIVLLYKVWKISPFCLVARQPSIIMSKKFLTSFYEGEYNVVSNNHHC